MDMRVRIREMIGRDPDLIGDVTQLRDDDDLFDAGLTSLGAVRLVLGIEDDLGIEIPDDALSREAFASIEAIARLVEHVVEGTTAPS